MSFLDFFLIGLILALAAAALWYTIRHKGCSGCSGCGECPHSGKCARKRKAQ